METTSQHITTRRLVTQLSLAVPRSCSCHAEVQGRFHGLPLCTFGCRPGTSKWRDCAAWIFLLPILSNSTLFGDTLVPPAFVLWLDCSKKPSKCSFYFAPPCLRTSQSSLHVSSPFPLGIRIPCKMWLRTVDQTMPTLSKDVQSIVLVPCYSQCARSTILICHLRKLCWILDSAGFLIDDVILTL
jgi:hypothetical protein